MNFHSDEQHFQVAEAMDGITDPWIGRPELYPYTTGAHNSKIILPIKGPWS